MKASEILAAMGQSADLTDTVLSALGAGMMDEWDCGLDFAVTNFGPAEWQIAAKTGVAFATTIERRNGW